MESRTLNGNSMTEDAYHILRDELLACRLVPGSKLKVSALSETFGFSPGAVREALSRLSSEDLVIAEPQRGFTASPVSETDLMDLTEARVILESTCIKKSMEYGDIEWETQLVAAAHRLKRIEYKQGSKNEWGVAHIAFHDALVAGCHNQTLLEIRNQLLARSERYRRMALKTPNAEARIRKADDEHQLLFEAVMAGKSTEAAKIIRKHIITTSQSLLNSILAAD